jgi:alpha-beta hydrolase superfamily lysophospholipase
VLILHGGADRVASPARARIIYDAVSSEDRTITVYPELYHEILNEPEQATVIADIIAWIRARSSS